MAGTIEIDGVTRWSAASWLFDFVLTTVAQSALDAELSGELTGIVGENLGWLALVDLTPRQRGEFVAVVNGALLSAAEAAFPIGLDGRAQAFQNLNALIGLLNA